MVVDGQSEEYSGAEVGFGEVWSKRAAVAASSLYSILENDNVLYRSLPGLASRQQVSGLLAGDGDHSLKWMAAAECAQWHS